MDKRKLAAALALGGSIVIGALLGGDSDSDNVSGSYRGGYYTSAGSYTGGATTAVETVTVVFAANTDTTSMVHTEFASDVLEAINSGGGVYDLLDAANGFAFGTIDASTPNITSYDLDATGFVRETLCSSAGTGVDAWTMNEINRRHELFYIPFEDFIPAGSQIVSATVKKISRSTLSYVDRPDTLIATLISTPDSLWHTSVGLTTPTHTRHSHVTWDYQISALNTYGYPATGDDPWTTSWDDIEDYFHFGNYSDWSPGPSYPTQAIYDEWDIKITNCVQAAVNGNTNNGIVLHYKDNYTVSNSLSFFSWESVSPYNVYDPYVVVQYLTKPYAAPLPDGKDFAFIFVVYDGNPACNTIYKEVYQDFDGGFTSYVIGANRDMYSFAKIDSLLDEGNEVSSHSLRHLKPYGLGGWQTFYKYGGGAWAPGDTDTLRYSMPDTSAYTYQDSLRLDASPDWLYDWAEDYDGDRRETLPRFGKGFGLPQGFWSPEINRMLCDMGYIGMAYHIIKNPNATGVYDYYDLSDLRPDATDTTRPFIFDADGGRAKNMRVLSFTTNNYTIVGDVLDTTTTDAEIIRNTLRHINQIIGQGRTSLIISTHDLKTDPDGVLYADGIDGDELRVILETVRDANGIPMTATDYARWMQQWATAVPTPSGFATPDTFTFSAEDEVWYEPDGIDGRFIRGLR